MLFSNYPLCLVTEPAPSKITNTKGILVFVIRLEVLSITGMRDKEKIKNWYYSCSMCRSGDGVPKWSDTVFSRPASQGRAHGVAMFCLWIEQIRLA